jgi:hypothetical protein
MNAASEMESLLELRQAERAAWREWVRASRRADLNQFSAKASWDRFYMLSEQLRRDLTAAVSLSAAAPGEPA